MPATYAGKPYILSRMLSLRGEPAISCTRQHGYSNGKSLHHRFPISLVLARTALDTGLGVAVTSDAGYLAACMILELARSFISSRTLSQGQAECRDQGRTD